jgi:hypothetical protein
MRLLQQEELHNNTLKVKKASYEFSQNSLGKSFSHFVLPNDMKENVGCK